MELPTDADPMHPVTWVRERWHVPYLNLSETFEALLGYLAAEYERRTAWERTIEERVAALEQRKL